jgi:D-arabinose 1-dehydrogenase-like Zn-dependent alcohol dehydrogenase
VNCRNQEFTGVHHDGGYAEVMVAKASGLVSIPDDLSIPPYTNHAGGRKPHRI